MIKHIIIRFRWFWGENLAFWGNGHHLRCSTESRNVGCNKPTFFLVLMSSKVPWSGVHEHVVQVFLGITSEGANSMAYQPVGPDPNFSQGSSFGPSTIVTIFVIFVVVIIAIGVIRFLAQQAKVSDLRQNGIRVMATVSHVEQRTRMSGAAQVNNQPPHIHHYYVVIAHWTNPQTGSRYIFTSDEKSSSPPYVSGDEVPVMVDRGDYNRYHIEI
jgi:hypothetical protein